MSDKAEEIKEKIKDLDIDFNLLDDIAVNIKKPFSVEPLMIELDHSQPSVAKAIGNAKNVTAQDKLLLSIFAGIILELTQVNNNIFGFLVEEITGQDINKPSKLVEYFFHALPATTSMSIILSGVKDFGGSIESSTSGEPKVA